jgi:hypothetical protein
VWRQYEDFISELSSRFPHEAEGIKKFYDECWKVGGWARGRSRAECKPQHRPIYVDALSSLLVHPSCLALPFWQALTVEPHVLFYMLPHLTQVFNSLNVIELKSLEEPRYLMNQVSRWREGGRG